MNQRQNEIRNQVARKTRRIVERQGPLELTEFLAQGRQRSRQQRSVLEEAKKLRFGSLPPATASL